MAHPKEIDVLINDLVMNDDIAAKQRITSEIVSIAKSKGIFLSSIHELYKARGEGKCSNFTVPAINLRGLTHDLARAIFRVAIKNNAGAFIFELAKSEMGYTAQPPVEYTGLILSAAVKEGYSGPVFIQGDHFQIKDRLFFLDPEKELNSIKQFIEDAITAGFLNIDLDSSTLVDLEKRDLREQQKDNFEVCARLTKFIREIQPDGVMVSVGGEIGEIGNQNSTQEELKIFMEGYLENLPAGTEGISKISVQTGTTPGGVVLNDGSIAQVKVDFDALRNLSLFARQNYSLGGAVQHGASTLPSGVFNKFVESEAVEIHLATQFQNMMFDSILFPKDLKERMYTWVKRNCNSDRREDQTEDQFLYKSRKKSLGAFKKELVSLPEEVRNGIAHEIEAKFDFLFKQLKISDTRKIVEAFIKPHEVKLGQKRTAAAVSGGQED